MINYRFGHQTAEFHICATCGVVTTAIWKDDDRRLGVINIRTLEATPHKSIENLPTCFDSETLVDRKKRRRANWMPMYEVPSDSGQLKL